MWIKVRRTLLTPILVTSVLTPEDGDIRQCWAATNASSISAVRVCDDIVFIDIVDQ